MILENTRLVTKENGVRPAGKQDECFYCHKKCGDEHDKDCVCFEKVIMIKIEMTIPMKFPSNWNKDDIECRLNDSTYCFNNITDDIENIDRSGGCICATTKAEYIRDATDNDMTGIDIDEFSKK